MADTEQPDQRDIKPSFSFRYIALATFVSLLPAIIGGGIGWLASEYSRDRRVIEVTSAASANLTPIAASVAGNLEILYRLNDTQKETIGGLFKFDVTLANTSSEGAADVSVIVIAPKDIEFIAGEPTIATDPPAAVNAVKLQAEGTEKGKRFFALNLLNTGHRITLSLYGFSRNASSQIGSPPTVVVQKKDWVQRNVDRATPEKLFTRLLETRIDQLTVTHLLFFGVLAPILFGLGRAYFWLSILIASGVISLMRLQTPRQTRRMFRLFE
jgi:hypothetical protein